MTSNTIAIGNTRFICIPFPIFIALAVIFALSCYSLTTIWILFALPAVYLTQKNRAHAWTFIFVFYLILNAEEITDSMHFFSTTVFVGIFLWIAHALLFSLVWVAFYKKNPSSLNAFIRTILFNVILMLPPLGFLVWVQPITISGSLFPGTGWLGIAAAITLMAAASVFCVSHDRKRYALLIIVLLFGSVICNISYKAPNVPNDISAINTHFNVPTTDPFIQIARQERMIRAVNKALAHGKKIIVLPENVTEWLPGTQQQWRPIIQKLKHEHAHLFIGRMKYNNNGTFDSGFEVLGGKKAIFLTERIPMPIGEWKPFTHIKGRFNAHWMNNGRYQIDGLNIAYLICYEQMVPYPILRSFLASPKPNIIISAANQWFGLKSGYVKQLISAKSFARLFDVPIMIATNY